MLGALGLGVLAAGCSHADPGTSGPTQVVEACGGGAEGFDRAAVVGVLEAQRAAWNAGDLDGFLAGYEASEALLFTSGGQIRRGFAETRDKYRARYGQARETMGELAFEILDVRPLGGCADAAVVLGRWAVTNSSEAGSGVFSVILERDEADGGGGGRWVIVHDHTSADPQAP